MGDLGFHHIKCGKDSGTEIGGEEEYKEVQKGWNVHKGQLDHSGWRSEGKFVKIFNGL